MTTDDKNDFILRINSVTQDDKAKFGQMNINQMICHCADQIRMALGEIKGLRREEVDLVKLRIMMANKETVPTVDGLNQAAGQGTKPTDLENDKKILIEYIEKFINCAEEFPFHFHPFTGDMNKEKWDKLISYHLNYHLRQFGR